MRVHIDFESRSACDIWEAGAWVYSRHPTTEILCICFAVDDGPVTLVPFAELKDNYENFEYYTSDGLKALFYYAEKSEVTFHAFNAFFEQCIWKNILVPKFGLPAVGIKRWRCTQSKSNSFGLPDSLEKAALAYGITQQKDMTGKNIMLKLSKTRSARKTDTPGQIYWNDSTPEDWELLYKYCEQDVIVERGLDQKLPNLSAQELEVWFVDQLINMRGVRTDVEFVAKVRLMLAEHNARLNGELSILTNGVVNKGTEVARMVSYLQSRGVQITDLTKETVSKLIKENKLDAHCLQVLIYRQELGKSSNAKYEKLWTSTDYDEIVRDCFVYHQASTGRWGGKLVQLQNLPVNRNKIDEFDAVHNIKTLDYITLRFIYGDRLNSVASACIRSVFIPRKNTKLLVVDYAAIEARGVFWLAGETTGLQEFRDSDSGTGPEIYVRMAQKIYRNPTLTKENKDERGLGKTAILGLGYQMGAKRFIGTCDTWGIKLPRDMWSVERINNEDVYRCPVVDLYRTDYPRVPKFWYAAQDAAISAVNYPGAVVQCGKVSFFYNKERDYLFIKIPSGRFLPMQQPRIEEGKFGPKLTYRALDEKKNWTRTDTYGGHLVENITQAVARDLMAYSMPKIEAAGLSIVMHTHDEIVSEGPEDNAEARLEQMKNIMCELPEWASGFPIKAEGFVTDRYIKK